MDIVFTFRAENIITREHRRADKLDKLVSSSSLLSLFLSRVLFTRKLAEQTQSCNNVQSHLPEQMAISVVVQTGGARPLRIFVFETINTPGAPFFKTPPVGLTLSTLSVAAVAGAAHPGEECRKGPRPELIKLMVSGPPKEADKLVR